MESRLRQIRIAKPSSSVWLVTEAFVTKWNKRIPKIRRWQFMWNASNRRSSASRRVHVSDWQNATMKKCKEANYVFNQTVNDGVAHSHFTTIIPCYHISDDPSIWLRPGAILVLQQNCPYLVTFDLGLEHMVDAGRPQAIRSAIRKLHQPKHCHVFLVWQRRTPKNV